MIEVSQEFLDENRQDLRQFHTNSPKRRGPYTKQDREARRNEVYRLHFDYGFSARKIADFLQIDKNTICGDVNFWYAKINKTFNAHFTEDVIFARILRLEEQRTRLRELLDKTSNLSEKITIERLIFDIESKLINSLQKTAYSHHVVFDNIIRGLNNQAEKTKSKDRWTSLYEYFTVSAKARERINEIIKADREKPKVIN